MESKVALRSEIHFMADKVKNTKVLQMVRNLLDFELREELQSGEFPQELKDELDLRKETLNTGKSKAFTVEESLEKARLRLK